eukprot:CAMPEP_0115540196 /NCGR_PEP_ID=MMETSP0271-20121206/89801_1 /TAXON_ID=71861 /ORGANISM="Scrippsiella trochoidea, Strain CCMP3099" /LENGTH=1278 /DNA_ID=CAMNT_0002973179 /DNA_START=100 /DNA_END=3933 /DNA_ORIENTATION=-
MAHALRAARSEGSPMLADWAQEISFLGYPKALGFRQQLSLTVPVLGVVLLVCLIIGLVSVKSWVVSYLARERKALSEAQGESDGEDCDVKKLARQDASNSQTDDGGDTHVTEDDEPDDPKDASLYRFASSWDMLLFGASFAFAAVEGACMPLCFFFSEQIINAINTSNDDGTFPPTPGAHTNRDAAIRQISHVYFMIAGVVMVARSLAGGVVAFVSDRMVLRVKKAFFGKLLQQGPSWHDMTNSAEMSGRLSQDAFYLKDGCGDQLVRLYSAVACTASGVICSFSRDWRMALIGGIAEAGIKMIRTIAAFSGQGRTLHAYGAKLKYAEEQGVMLASLNGFCLGALHAVVNIGLTLGIFAGARFVISGWADDCWMGSPPFGTCGNGGSFLASMFTLHFAFVVGLAQLPPALEGIAKSKRAANRLYRVIDQPLVMDLFEGSVFEEVVGVIAYENVNFSYPGEQSVVALRDFSLRVTAGSTAAFVGPSGSGKSTVLQLLLRFYDPQSGSVTLDGHDLRSLQVSWLRSRMALVEQEPVLFGGSIADNIAFGLDGSAQPEDIEKAAKLANAHDFISGFPGKYQADVGERGTQLSGGQKQRIAIARALVRNPAVLLLDEATSALDAESEQVVQDALDKLLQAKQRTTLIVAHRLTTVMHADQIYVVKEGRLVEKGKHSELMAKSDSLYASLAQAHFAALDSEPDNDALVPVDTRGARAGIETSPLRRPLSRQTSGSSRSTSKEALPAGRSSAASSFEDATSEPQHVPLLRLWAFSRPEYGLYALGVVGTAIVSLMLPLIFLFLGKVVWALLRPPAVFDVDLGEWVRAYDPQALETEVTSACLIIELLAVFILVGAIVQQWSIGKAAELLTTRLRMTYLEAILRQEVPAVRGILGTGLIPLLTGICTVGSGLAVAFMYSWKFTLSIFLLVPMMAIGHLTFLYRQGRTHETSSSAVVSDSVGNIRTVAAFGLQGKMLGRFAGILEDVSGEETVCHVVNSAGTGLSSSAIFLMYACTTLVGGFYLDHGMSTVEEMVICFFMLFGCLTGFEAIMTWMKNSALGREAANKVFELLDRSSQIDPQDPSGVTPSQITGMIEFRDVHFRYPSRPDASVFSGFTLKIEANTTVALVGHSGSGKSTVVGLLQRFYDPQRGSVHVDGFDLRDVNLAWLRSKMGFVQQEPMLMDSTVLENICYGLSEVSEDRAIEAAKTANAHNFIMQLPQQYHTQLGYAGHSRLSGGEKQRVAIARAVVREPVVLLLDEATSALDSRDEKLVQAALDRVLSEKKR